MCPSCYDISNESKFLIMLSGCVGKGTVKRIWIFNLIMWFTLLQSGHIWLVRWGMLYVYQWMGAVKVKTLGKVKALGTGWSEQYRSGTMVVWMCNPGMDNGVEP
jgi:hypothetical protein